ncbi:MAG: monovalent cation/H+ antiporter complex subunit F [Micrococcaceae bacterium]
MSVYVLVIVASCLSLATLMMLYRVAKGPSLLDRLIANDVLVSIFMAGIILDMAFMGDSLNIPLLLVLASIGFVSSVAVARYVRKQ